MVFGITEALKGVLINVGLGVLALVLFGAFAVGIILALRYLKRYGEYKVMVREVDDKGNEMVSWDAAGVFINPKSGMKLFRMRRHPYRCGVTSKDGKTISIPFRWVKEGRGWKKLVVLIKRGDEYRFSTSRIDPKTFMDYTGVTEGDINTGYDMMRQREQFFKKLDWQKVATWIFGIVVVVSMVALIMNIYEDGVEVTESNQAIAEANEKTAGLLNGVASALTNATVAFDKAMTTWVNAQNQTTRVVIS